MRKMFVSCAMLGMAMAVGAAELDRSTPEAEGVSSKAILNWIDACERELDAVHGFVLLRHGKTIAEGWWAPFSADRTHTLYSHSKSFTSTAAGLLADAGKLDLDERVIDIFPDKAPANPSDNLKALRIRDLLTMNTGMPATDPQRRDPQGDWERLFLANPVKDRPGTIFRYDSCATYMVAAIVERKSGMKLMDFLKEKLFREIGIEKAWSGVSPQGIACGGWGMNMTTRELARFGQLYLQEGRWGDRQILSKNWVRLATSYHTSTRRGGDGDWNQGYGFQFWRCRHNCFRADGACGQYTVVMPDQDAVISITAGLGPMDKELNLVWKHILPALGDKPLAADPAAQKALEERCAKLALKTVNTKFAGEPMKSVYGRKYALTATKGAANGFTAVRIEERNGGWELVFDTTRGEARIPVGANCWREGEARFSDETAENLGSVVGVRPVASSGAWTAQNTFRVRTYLHDTFFRFDLNFTFNGDDLKLDVSRFGYGGPASFVGKRVQSQANVDASAKPVRVAVFADKGAAGIGAFRHLQIATFAKDVEGYPVDGAMIRAGALDHADVLVMPGGWAPGEGETLGEEGRRRLKEYIRNGGGYIGTCAGMFLLMQSPKDHYPYLDILPYIEGQAGGVADLIVKYDVKLAETLGFTKPSGRIAYGNGPVVLPGKPVEGLDYKVLATYASDINPSKTPRPTMAGLPAVLVGTYGKGRFCTSAVHPEKDVHDHYLMRAAYRHVTGRKLSWTFPHRKTGQLMVGFLCDSALNVESAKFAQRLMRSEEFDVDPVSAGTIAEEYLRSLDVLLVPDFAAGSKQRGGLRSDNRPVTEAFLKRGGRIVTWGCLAQEYAKFGAGVTVVQNGDEALAALRAIAKEPSQAPLPVPPKVENPVRVAFYMDRGGGSYPIAELLEFAPEYQLNIINAEDIRKGVLKESDLSVQPGGYSDTQWSNLGPEGRKALVDYIRGGGNYYGICAGAYLALEAPTNNHSRLGLIPFKHDGEKYRGWKATTVDLTDEGRKVFETTAKSRELEYWGGPVMVPGEPMPDTDVKVLATYTASSISTCSPNARLPMTGKAAFVAGRVGKGKVFVSSPHPEMFCHCTDLVQGILKYLTGVKPTWNWNLRARRRGDYVVGYESKKNKDFARFCVQGLMHEPGFYAWDMHDRSVSNDMLHLDAVLLINPCADDFGGDNGNFIASGRPFIAIARTENQLKACANRKGVTVVRSYDEVIPLLKKLRK